MLIQGAIYFLIFISFIYLIYKWVAKPFLKSIGVKVDDDPEIKTNHTERLEKTKKEFTKTSASVEAVREERQLKAKMANMEEEIKNKDREIEDGDFMDEDKDPIFISSLNNDE